MFFKNSILNKLTYLFY